MASVDPQASLIRERLSRRRKRRLLTHLLVILLLAAVSGVVGYEYYSRSVGGGRPQESINVLLLGVEKVPVVPPDAQEGSDGDATSPPATPQGPAVDTSLQAAAVLTIDPRSGQAAVVSLPATVLMSGSGNPPDAEELPDSLAERYRRGGVEGLKEAVQQLLNVPIHHYVQVDFEGFVQAVDRLEGLTVTVDMPIVYRDGEGQEIFRLEPGEHRLDGKAALYYLRYRGNDWLGEAPRARRHREFFASLGRTLLERVAVSDLPSYLELYRAYVATDLDTVQMVRLAEMVWRAQPESIEVILLPGRAHEGMWHPDPEGVRELVGRLFYHPGS